MYNTGQTVFASYDATGTIIPYIQELQSLSLTQDPDLPLAGRHDIDVVDLIQKAKELDGVLQGQQRHDEYQHTPPWQRKGPVPYKLTLERPHIFPLHGIPQIPHRLSISRATKDRQPAARGKTTLLIPSDDSRDHMMVTFARQPRVTFPDNAEWTQRVRLQTNGTYALDGLEYILSGAVVYQFMALFGHPRVFANVYSGNTLKDLYESGLAFSLSETSRGDELITFYTRTNGQLTIATIQVSYVDEYDGESRRATKIHFKTETPLSTLPIDPTALWSPLRPTALFMQPRLPERDR